MKKITPLSIGERIRIWVTGRRNFSAPVKHVRNCNENNSYLRIRIQSEIAPDNESRFAHRESAMTLRFAQCRLKNLSRHCAKPLCSRREALPENDTKGMQNSLFCSRRSACWCCGIFATGATKNRPRVIPGAVFLRQNVKCYFRGVTLAFFTRPATYC